MLVFKYGKANVKQVKSEKLQNLELSPFIFQSYLPLLYIRSVKTFTKHERES